MPYSKSTVYSSPIELLFIDGSNASKWALGSQHDITGDRSDNVRLKCMITSFDDLLGIVLTRVLLILPALQGRWVDPYSHHFSWTSASLVWAFSLSPYFIPLLLVGLSSITGFLLT